MKLLNKKFVRTLSCAAVAVCVAAMLSVGAFAAEVDSTCVEGYLPPQEQMVQGDIALHSVDVAVPETVLKTIWGVGYQWKSET